LTDECILNIEFVIWPAYIRGKYWDITSFYIS